MALIQRLLIWLVIAVVGLAIMAFLLPDKAVVERSISINRPPSVIFSQVDRMANFNKWSPWFELEPQATYKISGAPAGVGSRLDWSGQKVGTGWQAIRESAPFERIVSDLNFAGSNATSTMIFAKQDAGTTVTWLFEQPIGLNPLDRWMGLLTPRFVGPDYERGLAKLKSVTEAMPATDFGSIALRFDTVVPRPWASIEGSSAPDTLSSSRALGVAFDRVIDGMVARNAKPAGYSLAIALERTGSIYRFRAGRPYTANGVPAPFGSVFFGNGPGGFVMQANHQGTVKTVAQTYAALEAARQAYGFVPNGPSWEVYLDSPSQAPVSDLRVAVLMPVK